MIVKHHHRQMGMRTVIVRYKCNFWILVKNFNGFIYEGIVYEKFLLSSIQKTDLKNPEDVLTKVFVGKVSRWPFNLYLIKRNNIYTHRCSKKHKFFCKLSKIGLPKYTVIRYPGSSRHKGVLVKLTMHSPDPHLGPGRLNKLNILILVSQSYIVHIKSNVYLQIFL